MSLNIDLLRRAQASIADPGRVFDMSCWANCIAGHIVRVATATEIGNTRVSPFEFGFSFPTANLASALAGFHPKTAEVLFSGGWGSIGGNRRTDAVAELDRIITAEEQRLRDIEGKALTAALEAAALAPVEEPQEVLVCR